MRFDLQLCQQAILIRIRIVTLPCRFYPALFSVSKYLVSSQLSSSTELACALQGVQPESFTSQWYPPNPDHSQSRSAFHSRPWVASPSKPITALKADIFNIQDLTWSIAKPGQSHSLITHMARNQTLCARLSSDDTVSSNIYIHRNLVLHTIIIIITNISMALALEIPSLWDINEG